MHMSSALCDYALCPIGADNWFYTTAKVQLPITMPQGNYTVFYIISSETTLR